MKTGNVRPVEETLREYARGTAGGLLFSIASLYTMEIWWQGYVVPPARLLVGGLLLFIVLAAFTFYIGVHADKTFSGKLLETFETIALGTALAAIVLLLAGQLDAGQNLYEIVTRLGIEGGSAAVGVAIGTSQFGSASSDDDGANRPIRSRIEERAGSTNDELSFALLGSLILTLSIGPTEEIDVIAYESPPLYVLITLILTLITTWAIISYARVAGPKRTGYMVPGGSVGEAVTIYGMALIVCGVMRWITGDFDSVGTEVVIAQMVFLGIPASLGAAAGRVLLR